MAETVSSKKVIVKKPLKFDVRNVRPPFLDEGGYEDVQESSGLAVDSIDDGSPADEDPGNVDTTVPAVNILGIASQTVRLTEGGQSTVDVVLLVTDSKGIEYYEVRLSKI